MTKYVEKLKNPCLLFYRPHLDVNIIKAVKCVGHVEETESVSISAPVLGMEIVF